MRLLLQPIALLILCLLAYASAQTAITSGTPVNGNVGGPTFVLPADPNDLLEISFTLADAANNQAYFTVLDQAYNYLGDGTGRAAGTVYVTTVCPSTTLTPTSYTITVEGTPNAAFTLTATLVPAALALDTTVFDTTIDGPTYYYYDVSRTNAPLEIVVHGNANTAEAVLQGTYNRCPQFDETSRTLLTTPSDATAWLTFTEQGVLSLSNLDPELRNGRWYFAVYGNTATVNKAFRLTAQYGLAYDDYNKPSLILLFIYPIIMLALLLPALGLTLFMNYTPGLLKKQDPRIGREEEDVKYPKKTSYFPFTVICGIFFFIPALQVAARAANDTRDEGDRDQCYYNEMCMKPSNSFAASNNIWSNAGYMWAGVAIVIYVFICKKLCRFQYLVSRDSYVVYSIGIAIILVGMMSLTYHICPTRDMFQWDTSFMFVTAGLLITELYRKYFHKHPRAWIPYAFFALLFIINFLASLVDITGTYTGRTNGINSDDRSTKRYIFRGCLTGFIIFVAAFLFYFYYLKQKRKWGEVKNRDWEGKSGWEKFYYKRVRHIVLHLSNIYKKFHPLRLIVLIGWFIVIMLIIWVRPDSDLTSSLLYIMVVSFLIFLGAYMVHKIRIILAYVCCHRKVGKHRGKHSFLALALWLYLGIGCIACWIVALIFFSVLDSSDKDQTPAESREKNRACYVMDFYDTHDVWHVISSVGLLLGALFVFHTDVVEGPLPKDKKKANEVDP